MKIAPKDTVSFLKVPDAQSAAALLYGPDAGLVRERSRAIAGVILGLGSDPINRVELSSDQVKVDPATLRDELCALSLMGGRRLVVLQNAGDKLAGIVESALGSLQTSTYLIVEADELSPSSALRQFFEKQPRCAALACYHDEGRGLEDTLRAALGAHGLRATPDAMQYLLTHLGNDRGVTLSEVGKIALYMDGQKEVTLEAARLLIGHNASESMEDICHAVACGNALQTEALLARLLHEGAQPVAIIRSLLRHFQRLEFAQAHTGSGQTPDQALALLRPPVFFKYAPPMKRALTLWSPRALVMALNLLLKTERELKSGVLSAPLTASHALLQTTRLVAA
jgi:DNA polymerase-3 subunit delta